jgi:hypothetical protein
MLIIDCPHESLHFPFPLLTHCLLVVDFWTQSYTNRHMISDDEQSETETVVIDNVTGAVRQNSVLLADAINTYYNETWVPDVVDAVVAVMLALHIPIRMNESFLRHIFPRDLAEHFFWKWTRYGDSDGFIDVNSVRLWYCGMTSDNKVLLLQYLEVKARELAAVLELVPSSSSEQQTPTRS